MTIDASLSPFSEEEDMFRATVREFLDRELEPHWKQFDKEGGVPRSFFRKAGEAGLLGLTVPEAYGGPGGSGVLYVVMAEELGRSLGGATVGSTLDSDLATQILVTGGNDAQKRYWAPKIMSG